MSLETVRTALFDMVKAISTVPSIKEEDEHFKPTKTSDYPFTRLTLMPAESTQQDLNSGKQRLRGLMRVDVFASKSLSSSSSSRAIVQAIVDGIKPQQQIILADCSLIIEASWIEGIQYSGTTINTPAYIRWSSYSL